MYDNRINRSAWLALAALLFGNVAGWMHVGCAHSAGGHACCAAESPASGADNSCRSAGQHHSHSHHASCHGEYTTSAGDSNSHDADSGEATSHEDSPEQPAEDPTQPAEEQVPGHDSDHCAVCQAFFASRSAASLNANAEFWTQLVITRVTHQEEGLSVPSCSYAEIQVRGPPQA